MLTNLSLQLCTIKILSPTSVRERLFHEIDAPIRNNSPNSRTHTIRKRTRSADCDSHGANPLLHLSCNNGSWTTPAGEHLHGAGVGDHFVTVPGFGDEDLDAQDVAPVLHAEDLIHPNPHPFQGFDFGDGPDQKNLLRRAGACLVLGEEVLDVANAVRDSDTACEQEDRPVRGKGLMSAVRAFDCAPDGQALVR